MRGCGGRRVRPPRRSSSTFPRVSLSPALISVCVQGTSTTWPRLRRRSRVGVSVLAQGQDAVCRSLAGKQGDRFEGVDWDAADGGGGVYVHGASLWLSCSPNSPAVTTRSSCWRSRA
ncbi:flavin reductase family protein [Streptomyces sp. TG1A-60]|uniref:flavin reductase family protein n=1 Tax=Streptomyces sp. TG1A-60 TaxID=3129111 RepID=UPI0030CF61AE